LKVAETFSLLAGLYPGRIDLGVGRASGTDPLTTFALQRDRSRAMPDDFPQQLAELLAYLTDTMPDDHPFARLAGSLPGRPERPEVWLLGSSPQSGLWAAELGLPYAFADFINPRGAEIAQDYRRRVIEAGGEPRLIVCSWIVCAETDEEARRLAASSRMSLTLLGRGRLIEVPPPDKALRFLEHEGLEGDVGGRRWIVGTPDSVREQVEALARDYGADEVMAVTITYDHSARRRSYELLADAFGLSRAAGAPRAA
jgi:luciferase family oxidoreductase group 1